MLESEKLYAYQKSKNGVGERAKVAIDYPNNEFYQTAICVSF